MHTHLLLSAITTICYSGQIHESIKRLITEQIRHKLILSEGEAKQSRVKSTMIWWIKCVSMVIAKAVSRNIAAKGGKMSEAVLDAQASFVMSEATGQEASSERESLDDDDVERNADLHLHIFNQEA